MGRCRCFPVRRRLGWGALLAAAALLLFAVSMPVRAGAVEDLGNGLAISGSQISGEQACAMIRAALRDLAKAEREQAFALDLDPGGRGHSPMVEAQLAILLERSSRLREVLRTVRQSAAAADPRVEQCSQMGFRALVESERLTTSVEEVLYGPGLGGPAHNAAVTSDAAPTASVPRP
jgi:hypothetical protein